MGSTYQIQCHDCKTPFEETSVEGVTAIRELAAAKNWTVNVPAWGIGAGASMATPGRKQRRLDFCPSCMAKKIDAAQEWFASRSSAQREQLPIAG